MTARRAGAIGPGSGVNWRLAAILGGAVGVSYALSPLTVWFALAAVIVVRWAERGLPDDERRWVRAMLVAAIALRVLAVAVLFMTTDHSKVAFSTFFGDEEFFIRRSIWLRNMALGIPIHRADLIYTFDEVGQTSYLYLLALIQVLVGPSPYGVHLLAIAFYLTAAVLLFRLAARTLGRMPAIVGLGLLLYLPSLFAWSISALKEPFFLLLTSAAITLVVTMCRAPSFLQRLIALGAVAAIMAGIESVRRAGLVLTISSAAAGVMLAYVARRPQLLVALAVATPILAGAALSRPAAQLQVYSIVRQAAKQHAGHIATAGYVYKTLDDSLYTNWEEIDQMPPSEIGRFLIRSLAAYIVVPVPWAVRSHAALAYIPEQIVWYVLVALVPFGLVISFRRDALVTALLITHAFSAAFLVAITSGNVGTLVRHRGLAIPYVLWVAAVGGCELIARFSVRQATPPTLRLHAS